MANSWLRLWHDMPTDPKFGTIARLSKQPKALVLATYLHIIVDASQNEPRGTFKMAVEDIASSLNEDEAAVQSIVDVMQGRLLNGNEVAGWILRQPVREDGATGERSSTTSSNYVYFVAPTDSDVVKIGFSKNPWSRAKDLQVGSSSKFELLGVFKTDTRHEFEIHKLFSATRKNGEWFQRSEALNLLIAKVISKDVESHEGCIEFLKSLDASCFVATTVTTGRKVATTKDTDTDKDTDKEEVDKSTSVRPRKKCPSGFVVPADVVEVITTECPLVDIDQQTAIFRDHTFKTARSDWVATWRNWMRTKQERLVEAGHKPGGPKESFAERDERIAAERYREATGQTARTERPMGEVIDITPMRISK